MSEELTREQAIQIINDSSLLKSLLYDLNLLPEQVKPDTKEEFYMLSVVAHFERSLAPVQEGKVPSNEEMTLDMDVDDIKDAIGKAYPSIDDMSRDLLNLLIEKLDRIHTLAYKNLAAAPAAPVQEGNEPTADMIAAGAWALCDLYAKEGGWCGHKAAEEQAIITWKAMQAASPRKEGE